MLDSNPFFRFVWRVNALALFAAAVITVLVGGWAAVQIAGDVLRMRHVEDQALVQPETPSGERLTWSSMTILPGARFARMDLRSEQDVGTVLGSGYKTAGSTRNLALIDLEGGAPRQLFDKNDGLVLDTMQFPAQDRADAPKEVTGFLVTAVTADSDKDGRLTDRDDKALLAWPVAASKPVTLLNGVRSISTVSGPPGQLIAIVEQADGLKRIEIDAAALTIGRTVAVQGLPKP